MSDCLFLFLYLKDTAQYSQELTSTKQCASSKSPHSMMPGALRGHIVYQIGYNSAQEMYRAAKLQTNRLFSKYYTDLSDIFNSFY